MQECGMQANDHTLQKDNHSQKKKEDFPSLIPGIIVLLILSPGVNGLTTADTGALFFDQSTADVQDNPVSGFTIAGTFVPVLLKTGDPGFLYSAHDCDYLLQRGGDVLIITRSDDPSLLYENAIRIRFNGQNIREIPAGEDPYSGKAGFLIGNDSSEWRTKIPVYRSAIYPNIYPGIRLVYTGQEGRLKSEFIVAPAADPKIISYTYEGSETVRTDRSGALVIETGGNGQLVEAPPKAYQIIGGQIVHVSVRYNVGNGDHVGFSVGSYDARYPLIIDPEIITSGHLGGGADDVGAGIAVDDTGTIYVAGYTHSTDFPVTGDAFDNTGGGFDDIFITAYTKNGSDILYSTYIGGSGNDYIRSILVDADRTLYIGGSTESTDFPVKNAVQPEIGGKYDAFITAISGGGTDLAFSTYLGGSDIDEAFGIALGGKKNRLYLTGMTQSKDFPTVNAYQETNAGQVDAFLAVIDPREKALAASTYLGGRQDDYSRAIALDDEGNIYIGGYTYSSKSYDFPVKNPLFGPHKMTYDAFVSKFNPDAGELVFSTYLGGTMGDRISALSVNGDNQLYMTGYTFADDFPTTSGAIQQVFGGNLLSDAFVAGLSPDGQSLIASTYLGGSRDDVGYGITTCPDGTIFITGGTMSTDFPVFRAWQNTLEGSMDVFVSRLDPACSRMTFSSYLGGEGSDRGSSILCSKEGLLYVTGTTNSAKFPTILPFRENFGGDNDAFLAVLSPDTESLQNQMMKVIVIPPITPVAFSGKDGNVPAVVQKKPVEIILGTLLG